MVQVVKFSQFSTASLNDSSNQLVGLGSGVNVRSQKVITWTTGGRPAPPFNGLLGYNATLSQYEYYDTGLAAWVQFANATALSAKYIVQQPSSFLPNAQSLSALTTGILKSTTVTGIISISMPLTSIDGLTTASDLMIYTTASNVYATTPLTALGRTLLANSTATAMRTTLGLGTAAVKNATDNSQTTVASAKGAFTIGHVLTAADIFGTVQDSGSPAGTGTVTSLSPGVGIGMSPNPITSIGTISISSPLPSNLTIPTPYINSIIDINANTILLLSSAPSAVNYIAITNTATNVSPGIAAIGTDADISLTLASQGTGEIALVTGALTQPLLIYSGTTSQHLTRFNMANTAADRSVTWQDASGTVAYLSDIPAVTPSALTKTDDTNVTLSLGGSPTTALLNATSLTLGWTGILSTTRGGLGVSNPTAHGILIGEGASAVTPIVLNSGQILIGSTGIDPIAAAMNSGAGILVANGAGSITVNLAAIADHTVLANISGGSLAPSSTTLTALIDNAIASTQGDILYRNATSWVALAPSTAGFVLTTGGAAANPSWVSPGSLTGAALTKVDDTNITLMLGGSPTTALLEATSITAGWTGTLSGARGGTGVANTGSTITIGNNFTMSGAFAFTGTLTNTTTVTFPTSGTLATTAQIPTGAALTKTDDTNVTLTLGGSPTTALVNAASLTLGWTGQLGLTRGGTAASLTASNGGIVYSTASAMAILAGTATVGQLLQSGASSAPTWTTTTYPATNAINTILYASSANVMAVITPVNSATLRSNSSGVPAWQVTQSVSAYDSGGTTLAANTNTKINLATENFDTSGIFTSSRFTPTIAGKYQISWGVSVSSGNVITTGQYFSEIYLNGALARIGNSWSAIAGFFMSGGSSLINMNGSTDYLELFAFNGNLVNTIATLTGNPYTFFDAVWTAP